ncbi:UDP-N-acetylmuramoyl-tripeptide--D-alanyl-D-alanine ligase [Aliishimia ponticola]|uniref:UDP-N-acetylmuramoyl-tripeptide--D-alanyl-D-alanine ligase n=1 Tax=Aliishimia ponticola TaxID=2499833 RepID=A0A4S4NHA6_9RHOB|nr:UDP-N-acetylmuramoyl-tripeptide--D-alanyl-D-alanine ligase [Aliishimia ponticola]THH39066.1 UDP-N-acetylmuramoyl-tripeptide--D-alanyl-D-alanine ligase [Aliishimia ponticola]
MSLWTANEAAAATGGQAKGDWTATGVSIDTRTIQPGDLFVALSAERDGHDFAAAALAKGAAAVLVSRIPGGVEDDDPILLVPDVLAALEDLGRAARARTDAKVIAVTGSVGKTSTKEMLRTILTDQGRTHASVASYNNHWGVPLTLARMPSDTQFAVIEIGMNHPGEIAPLARMAQPHVALITTVAPAHLEAFESIEGIAHEKASILDGLVPGGVAVLNADISTAGILTAKAQAVGCASVSFGEQARDYVLEKVSIHDTVTVIEGHAAGEPLLFKLPTPGRHFAMNAMGALASAEAVGADRALALQSLGRWSPYRGRGAREVIHLDPIEDHMTLQLIDESYNANPTSAAAALEVLAAATVTNDVGRVSRGRRIAVLGDMKELGSDAADLHAGLARLPQIDQVDVLHCVGPLMRHLFEALPPQKRGLWTETSAEMADQMRHKLDSGDVVMVKGSLSMKLASVVDAIRKMGHSGDQLDHKIMFSGQASCSTG